MEQWNSLRQNLNPLADKLNKQFAQARQWSQEKFGAATDVTELPREYLELEKKVDALKTVHQNLIRITRTFQNESYDYPTAYQETLVEFSRSAYEKLQEAYVNVAGDPNTTHSGSGATSQERSSLTRPATGSPGGGGGSQRQPKTLYHATSRACINGAEAIGLEDPFGSGLFKYATILEKVGDARLKMDNEIVRKFLQPFTITLNTNIQLALKSRKMVHNCRLNLDALKNQFKNAKPEKISALRGEVERAEDKFIGAVEEAMINMKNAINSPEPLRNLADMINAQLNFFKDASDILSDLAVEIDEMQVMHEATFRSNRN